MRRYGWSSGNIGANGHCVLLETEQTNRGSTSYLRQAQEDLSTDSCGENIRYQAVEGLVQNSRHQMGSKAHLLRSVSVKYNMLQKLSKCEVKAARNGHFSNLSPLGFYVKSNFGELKRSKNVIFGNFRV